MEQAPAASMDAGAAEIDTANPADAGAAPTPQQTGGTGSASGSAAAGAIGDKCGPNDACVAGATCVKYYGIAGPRGPQFTSCEIKCSPSGKPGCPTGKKCVTIADGPGSVCR